MNEAALKTLIALILACALFAGSAIIWLGRKSMFSFFQLLGAAALVVVALAHVFELLRVFPRMGSGFQGSVGHYLDFLCAILGITLFSLGYLLHAVDTRVEKKKSE
jgi:amino acid permease